VEIIHVAEGSLAEEAGLVAGDRLVAVDGRKVRDFLDLHLWLGEEFLELTVEHEKTYGEPFVVSIRREYGRSLGLSFPDPRIRICGNDCPFCFVDQLPSGVRRNLNVRDDDYRFSYLYGNFVTLTNLKEWEFDRIIEQQLSPMYVSVHALDPAVRERCLRSPRAGEIRERLEQLIAGGIEIHTQIVAVPGINDGAVLEETIFGLSAYYPAILTAAVVPVGLTGHREGLPPLQTYTRDEAARIVQSVRRYGRALRRLLGTEFVYVADEFVVLAGKRIPAASYYGDFPQTENGVGLVRKLLLRFQAARPERRRLLDRGISRVVVVTGESFGPILAEALESLGQRLPGVELKPVVARNHLFGRPVSVAGLLGGRDIAAATASHVRPGDLVLIPDECRNADGVFLDDLTLADLETELGVPVSDSWDPLLQDAKSPAARLEEVTT